MTKVGSRLWMGLENRVVSMWSRKIPLVRMVQDDLFRMPECSQLCMSKIGSQGKRRWHNRLYFLGLASGPIPVPWISIVWRIQDWQGKACISHLVYLSGPDFDQEVLETERFREGRTPKLIDVKFYCQLYFDKAGEGKIKTEKEFKCFSINW